MEIRIKTHEEFQRDRVTVEITGSTVEVGQRLLTEPLLARVTELEADLAIARDKASGLEAKLAEAEKNREGFSRARADLNQRMKTHGASTAEKIATLRDQVAEATRRIDNARTVLRDAETVRAREHIDAIQARMLADTIGMALTLLGD